MTRIPRFIKTMCMLAALTLTASSVAAQGRNVVVKPSGPIAGQYIVVFNDSVAIPADWPTP